MNRYYTAEKAQQILIALLKAHGIRKVVASPGTTNVTFVGSLQNDPWFEMYSCADERSAAYMATGLAAESGEPVVITCTGATASRNYLSALTEAWYRKLPVLAVTANQGREKLGHLVAQNIDRSSVPDDVVRMSVSIPVCKDAEDEWNAQIQINKALLELSHAGGGPVHIDISTSYNTDFSVRELPAVRKIERICHGDVMPQFPSGVSVGVYVGSHKDFTPSQTEALDRFCASHDAVVLCDHTSGYYGRYRVQMALVAGQKLSRSALLEVGLLIHIGEVSGDYYSLKIRPKEVWRVNEDGQLRDTFRRLSKVFEMREEEFFGHYSEEGASLDSSLMKYRAECGAVAAQVPELPFSNIWIAGKLSASLPAGSVLHLGILNSLRSWNFFPLPESVRSYSNVGGFGIDGCMSSLVGASLCDGSRIFFGAFGDLAFFYDMNVAGNRHVPSNVRILLVNNGRGVEFRNYGHVCHQWGEDADPYMAAAGHYGAQSPDLVRHYAEDLGYEYLSASDKDGFMKASERFLTPALTDRPMIFEVFTDHDDESQALELMLTSVVDKAYVLKNNLADALKDTVGEAAFNRLRKLLK